MKRVLLIVVDGCTSRILRPALERGDLPLLGDLAAQGTLRFDCVSVFPSITPAATASIITGCYPATHGIEGMSWSNPDTGEVAYFGDDVGTILRKGIGEFLRGFLLRLNGDQLKAPTLFQFVEQQGLRAGCINYLIFRGDVSHAVSPPLLLRLFSGLPGSLEIRGPSWLRLGDFLPGDSDDRSSTGAAHRFGLDDEGTYGFLREVSDPRALPDFTLAYFPDYDFESHTRGPADALDTLRTLDKRLREVFDGWGGVARVLRDIAVVLTADHSHSEVGGGTDAAIQLPDLLSDFHCADPGSGWRADDEILLCPNMRAAEVYVRHSDPEMMRRVCTTLLTEPHIDQVVWLGSLSDPRFHVATRDRGALEFRPADGRGSVADAYGNRWQITGEPGALDLTLADGEVGYGAYPNALERIANGVTRTPAARFWVTARPGFEFREPGQHVHHNGGSHGSLHQLDSLVPLLLAGHPSPSPPRVAPRIIDVAPLCAETLGLSFPRRPGQPYSESTNGG